MCEIVADLLIQSLGRLSLEGCLKLLKMKTKLDCRDN